MNFGKFALVFFIIAGIFVYTPDLLQGIARSEKEIISIAHLIDFLVGMTPWTGQEVFGMILLAVFVVFLSQKK